MGSRIAIEFAAIATTADHLSFEHANGAHRHIRAERAWGSCRIGGEAAARLGEGLPHPPFIILKVRGDRHRKPSTALS